MNKGTIGHTLILVGNVLHGFIFSVLFIENLHSPLGYFYATALLMLIPSIIRYIKCKQTTNNTSSNYFIVIGLLLTIGFRVNSYVKVASTFNSTTKNLEAIYSLLGFNVNSQYYFHINNYTQYL